MNHQAKHVVWFLVVAVSTAMAVEPMLVEPEQRPSCGFNQSATELSQLIKQHPSQQRQLLQCNDQLVMIAQQRAEQLGKNNADPEITPNQIVIKGGFRVPNYYPVIGNQVEAVAKKFDQANQALNYLIESGKHHDHIMGKGEFFALQSQIGVGYFKAIEATQHNQWVVLIAQPWQSPKIIYNQEFNMSIKVAKGCDKDWQNSNDQFLIKKCSNLTPHIRRKKN